MVKNAEGERVQPLIGYLTGPSQGLQWENHELSGSLFAAHAVPALLADRERLIPTRPKDTAIPLSLNPSPEPPLGLNQDPARWLYHRRVGTYRPGIPLNKSVWVDTRRRIDRAEIIGIAVCWI